MKVRKEELAKKMLDFEWESSEVAAVNAVREVVAPGSGKFPARPTSFYSSTKPAHFFSPITSTNFDFSTTSVTKQNCPILV